MGEHLKMLSEWLLGQAESHEALPQGHNPVHSKWLRECATEIARLTRENEAMREALKEAALQLEYMQERMPTGTSAAVLSRVYHVLTSLKDSAS